MTETGAGSDMSGMRTYARDMVDEGVQLHSGARYMKEYEICLMFMVSRINRILAGSPEVMKDVIGGELYLAEVSKSAAVSADNDAMLQWSGCRENLSLKLTGHQLFDRPRCWP
ncbi:acyl-CoA dehydrogenase family protein [Novosphingobium olei]|uniref:acyl-CoA dehydrogenase family protein n=1 Tax=Novosphingobium olei TaxID=2728851 RepID=UPI0019825BB8|nr:acyl-CoA dehydrogenase family protein [Novosphingobium olei]